MRTLIKGGLVVDASGREPMPGGVVAIEDGKIVAVGRAADFGTSAGDGSVIDATGCTVMPGLIDGHVHVLSFPRRSGFCDTDAAVWGRSYLQAALHGGVTTIRDLGEQYEAIFSLKKGIQSGWLVGPRLLICGAAICMTGGHGWETFSVEADGPDAVRQAARAQIKRQVDVIKLMASGGVTTANESPTSGQLTVEELRAGVEEAHKAGLPATAHGTPTIGIKNAILAGVDSVEHGTRLDDEAIEMMLKNGTVLVPTLAITRRIAEAGQYGISKPYMAQRAGELAGPHFESYQKAVKAGVKMAMGTDCGSPWHPLGDVASELELMVEGGMGPLAAIEASTRASAENCHIQHEVGTLEPGKLADVLVVEGDAVADIKAMARVRWVLRDGATVYDAALARQAAGLLGKPAMGPLPSWLQA